jgi:hypothetical protein
MFKTCSYIRLYFHIVIVVGLLLFDGWVDSVCISSVFFLLVFILVAEDYSTTLSVPVIVLRGIQVFYLLICIIVEYVYGSTLAWCLRIFNPHLYVYAHIYVATMHHACEL